MFKDCVAGDILHFSIKFNQVGRNSRGTRAAYVTIKNMRTSAETHVSFNQAYQYNGIGGSMNYKGIELKVKTKRGEAMLVEIISTEKALRGTHQAVWIPCKHFEGNELKEGENIDYVFRRAPQCLAYAGYHEPIEGIVRRATLQLIIDNEIKRQNDLVAPMPIEEVK